MFVDTIRFRKTNCVFKEVDFTVPLPPLSLNRRVLSTPDLGQYEGSSSGDLSPCLSGVSNLTKQYSVDLSNSLGKLTYVFYPLEILNYLYQISVPVQQNVR